MVANLCGIYLPFPHPLTSLLTVLKMTACFSQCFPSAFSQVTKEAEQASQVIVYVGFNQSRDYLKYCYKLSVPVWSNSELTQAIKAAITS